MTRHRYRKQLEELREQEHQLPGWLWFFLILPIALVVALLYRQRRKTGSPQPPRYTEPDSIPLDMSAPRASDSASTLPGGFTPNVGDEPRTGSGVDVAEGAAGEVPLPETEATAPSGQAETARDDLKVVEGIGPSISEILNTYGIHTFRQLADTPVDRLVEILTEVRLNRIANPGTWPEQARLAAEGRWNELKAYQDTLTAGKKKGT